MRSIDLGESLRSARTLARFEYKYRVIETIAQRITERVGFHLDFDGHSTEGFYLVNSLYFDTPDNRDGQETDEGVGLRSKVRLRCYQQTPEPPYFLELKQRFGTSIYKTRVGLDAEDAQRLVDGRVPLNVYRVGRGCQELDAIREVMDHREMTPRVWVKYRRRAFVSAWGDGVRVTLDRDLESQSAMPGHLLSPSPEGWCFPEIDGRTVLELKFFGAAPRWMQRLAHEFELNRTSCSKYCLSLTSTEGPSFIPTLAEPS